MMRVLHIESSLDWGGQELRIVEQTQWLNANGHHAWIMARPGAKILDKARRRNVPVIEQEIRGSAHPGVFLAIRRFVKTNAIDIVDCHGNRDSTYGAYLKWFCNVPVVRSRHVTDPIGVNAFKRLLWRYGNDEVIVTAGKIRDMLVDADLSTSDKIHVAIAGVDETRFSPMLSGQLLRERLNVSPEATIVANVGMIRPDKGQLQFVRAANLLLNAESELAFIQLGEATGQTESYKQAVLQEVARGGHEDAIHFLGYQDDIENWLAAADIVVIASIATEAQTRLVAQAFLMKKNLIATTVGGLPEMIVHEHTGLLVEPESPEAIANAVKRLRADPGLAARLRENAYHHALENMSFECMMDGMLASYRRAIGTKGCEG